MPLNVTIHFTGLYTPAAHAKSVPVHFGPVVADVTGDINLVAQQALVMVGAYVPATIAGEIHLAYNAPTLVMEGFYDNNVFRGPAPVTGAAWQVGAVTNPQPPVEGWQDGVRLDAEDAIPWTPAVPTPSTHQQVWEQAAKVRNIVRIPWGEGEQLTHGISGRHEEALPIKASAQAPWQVASRVFPQSIAAVHEEALPVKREFLFAYENALYLSKHLHYLWQVASKRSQRMRWVIPWQEARRPPPGVSADPPHPPEPPVPPVFEGDGTLHFICPWLDYGFKGVPIHFGLYPCEEAAPYPFVPVLRLYMILNTISMRRADDDTPIEIDNATVTADQSSWCWTLSGSLPGQELAKIVPDAGGPVEVILNVNGIEWNFFVESYDRKRTFGKTTIGIRGRSTTALLDAPYAPTRAYTSDIDYYLRALVQAELDRVPGPTWGLDWPDPTALATQRQWDADDGTGNGFLVPTGLFTYTQFTPMQAINYLVQSVGGYVQSHRTDKSIIVSSSYPRPHWNWGSGTPDLVLPKDVIMSDSLNWEEQPQYNRVYVTGKQGGQNILVRKADIFPIDIQAPQYVHEFITDTYPAREKGKNIISASGKQAKITFEVPVDPTIDLSIITPGMLLKMTDPTLGEPDWRGLVRGVSLTARASDREIRVSQTVNLERHY